MRTLSLVLALLLYSVAPYAQTGRFFSSDSELSNSLVNQVCQDSKGYIWITTENGLNKYDGSKFISYKHNSKDSTSIKDNYVRTVFEDSKGRIWIGCINGLMRYHRHTDCFEEIPLYGHRTRIYPHITGMIEARNGTLWVTTSGQGLLKIKEDNQGVARGHRIANELNSQFLTCIYEDYAQQLWIGTENNGLCLYNPHTEQISNYSAPEQLASNHISCIIQDKGGNLFIGTLTAGLQVLRQSTTRFVPIPHSTHPDVPLAIKSLHIDPQGRVLAGTDGRGVKLYNPHRRELDDYPLYLPSIDLSKGKAHSIINDRDGNLWLGLFQQGVCFIPAQPNKFTNYGYLAPANRNIGSSCVMAIYTDQQENVWIGTDNDGLYRIHLPSGQKQHYAPSNGTMGVPANIMSILQDSHGHIWLGSYASGLALFDPHSGNCKHIAPLPDASLKVSCMVEDAHRQLWVGTLGLGVFKINLDNLSEVSQYTSKHEDQPLNTNALYNNWVNTMICDSKGTLWIGTYKGLSSFDTKLEKFTNYTSDTILPSNVVLSLYEDHNKHLWIGTTEGLACYQPNSQRHLHYSTAQGLPSNIICAIQEDTQGNIWASTHMGISKIEPTTTRISNYYASDGLQANEFSKGAAAKGLQGQLFFGGIKGVTEFVPERTTSAYKDYEVYVTDLYVLDKRITQQSLSGHEPIVHQAVIEADTFTLAYNDNMFSLELSCFQYASPEQIVYEYMLDGLNPSWVSLPVGSSRITFTSLPASHYTLKIRARSGNYSSPERHIALIVTPPWYQTWWAYTLYAAAVLLLLAAVAVYLYTRIKHKQEKLKQRHAQEINEAKLQYFINISHDIRTPMTLIISPLERLLANSNPPTLQKTYLMMHRNAKRILRFINQLMDIRKIEKGQMQLKFRETDLIGFIDDLMLTFDHLAKKKNIQFEFCHSDPKLMVWIDLINFDKVLLNLLSNSFKFTPDHGRITVDLSTGTDVQATYPPLRRYFEIRVCDTGIGIAPEEAEQIFERFYQATSDPNTYTMGTGIGLHLCKSLMGLLHGTIVMESNPEAKGSCFVVRLPLGKEHLQPGELEKTDTLSVATLKRPSHEMADNTPIPDEVKTPAAKSKHTVLVVDDEPEIRQYLKDELQPYYKIKDCVNGKEALEYILQHKPDLVISDIMMPEMDGITLCRKLKANANVNHIPIILLTAKTSEQDRLEGLGTGADSYITKPFGSEILRTTVDNLIGNRERVRHRFESTPRHEEQVQKVHMKSADEQFMEKVMRIINEQLAEPTLNVEVLATRVGMSRVHIHRKLKELTGQSARDFIKTIRLKQAADLLTSKKLTVSEVAYALGFSNLSHFSASFKEFYGMSPTEYIARKE